MPSLRPVCAMLISFHSAELDQDVGGRFRTAGGFAAHDAGEQFDAVFVRDHADARIERVGAAVERQQALAVAGPAHGEMALHLGGVEHMQRPAPVVGHEVGDIDQRVDWSQPNREQALLQPFRRRPVLDAAHQPQREARTQQGVLDLYPHGRRKLALDRLDRGIFELAHVGGGKIAGDAVNAGAIGAVRRQVDFEHGIAEAGPLCVSAADRRILRQLHDAVVILRQQQFGFRAQHAAALDAADGADGKRDVLARNIVAGRREHADETRARVRRAAHDLYRRCAVTGIDHADAQAISIGMLLGRNHPRDRERGKQPRLVLDVLDLEPDHGELVGEFFDRLSRCRDVPSARRG